MSRLGSHPLLSYNEWKIWISKTCDVILRDVKSFLDIPAMIEKSGIYRKWNQVKDSIGNLQLKTDRPLSLHFGWVQIDGRWKYFPNSVLVRFTMEDQNVFREFPLVVDQYNANLEDTSTGKTYPNIFYLQNIIQEIFSGTKIQTLQEYLSKKIFLVRGGVRQSQNGSGECKQPLGTSQGHDSLLGSFKS